MAPRKNNMTVLAQIVKQIPVPDQLQYEMIRYVMQGCFLSLERLVPTYCVALFHFIFFNSP